MNLWKSGRPGPYASSRSSWPNCMSKTVARDTPGRGRLSVWKVWPGCGQVEVQGGCQLGERGFQGGMTVSDETPRQLWGELAQDEREHDVWLMARRMALLYHYLTRAIVDKLGEEEGKELVREAVWQYGVHCGEAVRARVLAAGLEPTLENFRAMSDLPGRGWRSGPVRVRDGRELHGTTLCPLARTWEELGEGLDLARLYCLVDQAKIAGYNGDAYECVHAHHVLDGDGFCEIVFRPKAGQS